MDIAISVDGIPLIQSGSAVADSGMGDIAIAIGAGSTADAGVGEGAGLFDTAFASGDGSTATSGGGNFDSASANGADSNAFSADGNYDSAFASGTGSNADAGGFSDNLSSFDYSSAVGTNSDAESGVIGDFSGLTGADIATVFDPSGTVGSTALAGNGVFDLGAVFSDGVSSTGAVGGSFLVDIVP
jgi:hypothetical protein